jgi:CHRD domain
MYMVKTNFTRFSTLFLITGALSFGLVACDDDDDDVTAPKSSFTLSASANAAQEVPPNASTATGTLTGTYDSVANSLTFQVNWTGLTGNVTNMHFHGPALAGVPAAVALGMPGFPTTNSATGTHSGTLTLTQAQEADLMAGKWYWNVHTSANGGGEIRGQVAVQ